MPVFHPNSFIQSELKRHQEALGVPQIFLLEKCLLALELTGRLQQVGLNFVFKGGTSLLLHFDTPKRLSIDVDIVCLDGLPKLEEVLNEIVKVRPFLRWEHQARRDREAPPTKHFLVYYESQTEPGNGQSIQIDVIQAECPHAQIIECPISASFGTIEEAIAVPIPTASSLLGDKLATLAPSTIGYPYQPISRSGNLTEPRPIKVAKHLFDLGELAMVADTFEETVKTYQAVHQEQQKYRGVEFEIDACLDDTQDVAYWTSIPRIPKQPENKEKYDYMRQGIESLKTHLIDGSFGVEAYRNAAGRAALVAELVRREQVDFNLPEFLTAPLDIDRIKAATLDGAWKYLEGLRKTETNAFVCWVRAQELKRER